jgi:hypothetical protein
MWIYSKLGVFSVTRRPRGRNAPERKDTDARPYQVRARRREDLEALLEAARVVADVRTTPDADYPFRFFCGQVALEMITTTLAKSVTYENFKGEMSKRRDKKLDHVLHDVHQITQRLAIDR